MKTIYTLIFILLFALPANAQKVEVEQTFIDDATKAFTEVVALRAELKTANESIEKLKKEIVQLQIDLAKVTGEKTAIEKQKVLDDARLDMLIQRGRKKCIGLFCLQVGN